MKKHIFTLVLISLFFNISHAQQNTFSKVYNNNMPNGILANSLLPIHDDSYFILGESEYYDGLLIKADVNGDIISHKIFKNTETDRKIKLSCITPTFDLNFVLAGSIRNNNSGFLDGFYTKVDINGDTLWTKSAEFDDFHLYIMAISQTIDSGFIMCGYTYDNTAPYHDNYIVKVDSDGNFEWSKKMTIGNNSSSFYTVRQMEDESYLFGGEFVNTNPSEKFASIVNLSAEGEIIWSKKYQHTNPNKSISINDMIEINNDLYVYLNIEYSGAIMKMDLSGNIIWCKSYNTNDVYNSMDFSTKKLRISSNNSLVFVHGSTFGSGGITKVDTMGNILMNVDLFMAAQDVCETVNNEFFIIGNGPLEGVKDTKGYAQIGIIQIDSLGNGADCVYDGYNNISDENIIVDDASVSIISGGGPSLIPIEITTSEITITDGCVDFYGGLEENNVINELQVSPNPNNGFFTIGLNKNTGGILRISNAAGQVVSEIKIYQEQSNIDLRNHPKGVYYYKFISLDHTVSKGKIIIGH